MHKILKSLVIVLVLVSVQSLAASRCTDVFNENSATAANEILSYNPLGDSDLDAQVRAKYISHNVAAYKIYKKIIESYPELNGTPLHNGILSVLKDESLSSFHIVLSKIFAHIHKSKPANIITEFKNKVHEEIVKYMPEDKAKLRVRLLNRTKITKEVMMNALGRMTFQESLEALIGTGGIRNLQGDSLVSRYIEAARQQGIKIDTHVGTFSKGPNYRGRGGEKLFISVDKRTAPILEKIISDNPHLLMHNHDSGQGTLEMRHHGQSITYAKYDSKADFSSAFQWDEDGSNSIIPVVPLSSTEASQAINYFTLGSLDNKYAKYPWGLKKRDEQTQEMQEYCRTGGYSSCTHWIGEMPLGDKLVDTYSVPGYVDQYSDYADQTRGLRTKPVGEYNVFNSHSSIEEIGTKSRVHRLARMVWLQLKGREQLWSVVGDKKAEGLDRGEWANPGWVLYNFLTRSTQERVPVVFIFREDASRPLGKTTLDRMKDEISPY